MTGPTHIALGVAATLFLKEQADVHPAVLDWAAILIGALAPDIDAGNAAISRPGSLLGRFLPRTLQRLLDLVGTLLSKVVHAVFGHRKVLHWPLLCIGLFILGGVTDTSWLQWFSWGYLTHILGDACTKGGVPLFAPLSRKEVRWSPLKTGSRGEKVVFLTLAFYICLWVVNQLPQDTAQDLLSLREGSLGRAIARLTEQYTEQY